LNDDNPIYSSIHIDLTNVIFRQMMLVALVITEFSHQIILWRCFYYGC